MRHWFCLLFFFTQVTKESAAQSIFRSTSGKIAFYSSAPLEDIEAHNVSPNSILNIATREIAFLVPISNFKFKKQLMQEHFNEKFMESDKFPNAIFKGKLNDTVDLKVPGNYSVSATGMLTLHGIERSITESGTLSIHDRMIDLKSEFRVALADYHIVIPKLLFQNIADTILVKMNISYELYEKKH